MATKRLVAARFTTVFAIAIAAFTGACEQDGFSPGQATSSIQLVRQDSPTDTTHGAPSVVILRVFDESAQPAAGVNVRFDSPVTRMNELAYLTLYIGTDTTQPSLQASNLNYADTDDKGFVAVSVSRGAVPGRWAITVTSADVRNLRDSVVFVTTAPPSASSGGNR